MPPPAHPPRCLPQQQHPADPPGPLASGSSGSLWSLPGGRKGDRSLDCRGRAGGRSGLTGHPTKQMHRQTATSPEVPPLLPRILRAESSYARAASSAVSNVPSHSRTPLIGLRISAAHLPHGRSRTPRKVVERPVERGGRSAAPCWGEGCCRCFSPPRPEEAGAGPFGDCHGRLRGLQHQNTSRKRSNETGPRWGSDGATTARAEEVHDGRVLM